MLASIILLTLFFFIQLLAIEKGDAVGLNTHILSKDKKYKREYTYIVLSSILIISSIIYLFSSSKTLASLYIAIPSFSTSDFNFWLLGLVGLIYAFMVIVIFFVVFVSDKASNKKGLFSVNKTELKSEKDKNNALKTLAVFEQSEEVLTAKMKELEKVITTKLILNFISSNIIFILILNLIINHTTQANIFLTVLSISALCTLFSKKLNLFSVIVNILLFSIYIIIVLASGSIVFYSIISLLFLMVTQNVMNLLKKTIENKEQIVSIIKESVKEYEGKNEGKNTQKEDE